MSCSCALAAPLNKWVVFGDSLSDNGNLYEYMQHQLPLSPPYYAGRFCNGPLWIELLESMYYPDELDINAPHPHLLDYAFGGAGVAEEEVGDEALFTLDREVDSYLLAHQDKADESSMYVIWIGSNNYLALPDNISQSADKVNQGILRSIHRLVAKGAKHFFLVNLPDLGITPTARDFGISQELSRSSQEHNDLLKKNFNHLQEIYPEVQWLFLDVFTLLNKVLSEPQLHGFTNITDTCYEEVVPTFTPKMLLNMVASVKPFSNHQPCEGYFFFDPVHPGALAHQIMARNAKQVLDDAQVTFTN